MTTLAAVVPMEDPEAAVRWRHWRARDVDADRRRAAWLRRGAFLVALALTAWFSVVLT